MSSMFGKGVDLHLQASEEEKGTSVFVEDGEGLLINSGAHGSACGLFDLFAI